MYAPTDLIEPVFDAVRRKARAALLRTLLLQAFRSEVASQLPAAVARRSAAGACSRRSRTRRANGSTGNGEQRARRLGHFARRAILRHPDPGCAGQVLLRLARRADRLPRRAQELLRCGKRDAASVDFEEFLARSDTEQVHFIGKDIIYFHTLFWPAMLKFAGAPYKVPDHVYVHGFITVVGREDVQVARHRHRARCATSSSA